MHVFRRGGANEALRKLKPRQRYSIKEFRAELPPSQYVQKDALSAVEAAKFLCRILRFV